MRNSGPGPSAASSKACGAWAQRVEIVVAGGGGVGAGSAALLDPITETAQTQCCALESVAARLHLWAL